METLLFFYTITTPKKQKKMKTAINISILIVTLFIILVSRHLNKTELIKQAAEYEATISKLSDSLALEKEFHYNTFWYADSLRVVIQKLPDSASYIMLENELKTLSSSLNRESDINLASVRKIQSLTKINTILNQKTNENPKDILKNLLDKKD